MHSVETNEYIEDILWTSEGLVPAIAQDFSSGRILMMAWMNKDALIETLNTHKAVYWSRSRGKIWRKGETSGHQQVVKEVRLDCDADVIVLMVEQKGGIACHTGRESCFYRVFKDNKWVSTDPVLKDPDEIYS